MAKGRVLNGVLSGEALDSRQLAGEMACLLVGWVLVPLCRSPI